jgi:hypothetical protein
MDPLFLLRGIERLTIVAGGILVAYLGYKLYLRGASSSPTQVDISSQFMRFAASGTGPGLLFMAFGSAILVCSLIFGGVTTHSTVTSPTAASGDAAAAPEAEPASAPQSSEQSRPPVAPAVDSPSANAQRLPPVAPAVEAAIPTTVSEPRRHEEQPPRVVKRAAKPRAKDPPGTAGVIEQGSVMRAPAPQPR